MGQDREQVGARRPWLLGASKRFAIDRHGVCGRRGRRGRRGWGGHDTVGPSPSLGVKHLAVQVPQDGEEGGGTGRFMGQTEGLSNLGAVSASPCGDGPLASVATQQGATGQSQNGPAGRAFALRMAEVGEVSEDLEQGTGLWYHDD